ncbi:hypothetical protein EMQ25_13970 [Arsenicitalea aurantiaca]|uniref:Uncharacterized protein n=1 Tax=Arsenicitalea aurantiaca TaxID=1783274 RepID=A0A433X567_9HYPH|nr:hypothetical protein [Arsenicitalea aurantiaca]RUT29235.1 hypothetical protein EMQ25_13970 [Arsenicitalea aurantiaca]
MKSDDYTLEASVAGHIGNEFGGANHVSVANSGPTVLLDYDASGALGEVAGSLDLVSSNSGWSGSLNGGVAFSRDVTTSSVGVGLRKVW